MKETHVKLTSPTFHTGLQNSARPSVPSTGSLSLFPWQLFLTFSPFTEFLPTSISFSSANSHSFYFRTSACLQAFCQAPCSRPLLIFRGRVLRPLPGSTRIPAIAPAPQQGPWSGLCFRPGPLLSPAQQHTCSNLSQMV